MVIYFLKYDINKSSHVVFQNISIEITCGLFQKNKGSKIRHFKFGDQKRVLSYLEELKIYLIIKLKSKIEK